MGEIVEIRIFPVVNVVHGKTPLCPAMVAPCIIIVMKGNIQPVVIPHPVAVPFPVYKGLIKTKVIVRLVVGVCAGSIHAANYRRERYTGLEHPCCIQRQPVTYLRLRLNAMLCGLS
jgi:hypothetical protein